MDARRFAIVVGDPDGVTIKTIDHYQWGCFYDGQLVFRGREVYDCCHWLALVTRLVKLFNKKENQH